MWLQPTELCVCVVQDMSHKDLQAIDSMKWDPPFPYDPASGWKKSSVNVKNYGRMVHSSRVRFRFLHCQVSSPEGRFGVVGFFLPVGLN